MENHEYEQPRVEEYVNLQLDDFKRHTELVQNLIRYNFGLIKSESFKERPADMDLDDFKEYMFKMNRYYENISRLIEMHKVLGEALKNKQDD